MTLVASYNAEDYTSPQRIWDDTKKRFIDEWMTINEFNVLLTDGREIHIPLGFVYDKGSVPRLAWWMVPRDDRSGIVAFLVHDWLYTSQETSRKEADQIMYELLRDGGMRLLRAKAVYYAVRAAIWRTTW